MRILFVSLIVIVFAAGCQGLQETTQPTMTSVGYAPIPTSTPTASVPSEPVFYVNGALTAQARPGDKVVLFWDTPQASQVWIAQHTVGVWCPGGETVLKPDMIYGPLPPTGIQRVTISDSQTDSLWFDLYVDTPILANCQSYPSDVDRVDVNLVQPVLTSTPLPTEYFLVDSARPLSVDEQGRQHYETPLGEYIFLAWSVDQNPVYLEVDKPDAAPVTYGPLPRTSALKVCPSDGTRYSLYSGGKPGTGVGKMITIEQSPSAFQYWPSSFVPCWNDPN